MGLDPQTLPDAVLKRIAPEDRKSADLPPPMSELVSRAAAKRQFRREKELQNQIDSWLRLHGIMPIRSATHRKTSNNVGCPDFLFAVHGQAVAIEAKLPGQQPTEDQRRMLKALAANGWKCAIVTSLDEARAVVAALL